MLATKPATLARRFLPAVLVALMLLAGLALPPVMAAPLAQSESELVGDFATTIPDDWIPRDVANSAALIGRWRLTFSADGTYEAARLDVGPLVTGTYVVEGQQVTLTDEEGLMSCASGAFAGAGEDITSGTYTWEIRGDRLTFTLVEDGCPLRQTLLTASEFAVYVACVTPALDLALPEPAADADARPAPAATPEETGASPLDLLQIEATAEAEDGRPPAAEIDSEAVEAEIDALLGQLTACWTTGDPARFLPLLSEDFRAQFLAGTAQERQAALDQLRGVMQVALTWERAGELTVEGDGRATAVVRTTALDEEEFVRYAFVFEDGQWRWDGPEA